MEELLRQMRSGTIDWCRKEVSKHGARLKVRPDPWSAIQGVMSSTPPEVGEQKQPGEVNSSGSSFLKSAVTRLVDNLAEAERQGDQVALQKVLEKRMAETRIACALLEVAAGNAGLPWDRGDGLFQEEDGAKSVRLGTLTITPTDLQEAVPALGWNLSLPCMLPFDDGRAVFLAGLGVMREKGFIREVPAWSYED
jgi:hypothetical protein